MSDFQGIQIKVSPEVLYRQVDDVLGRIGRIEGHFSSIENKINNSTNYWKGEAGEAHRRVYQESKEGIEEVLNDFRQTAENLRTIAGTYENTEKTVVAEAQGLLVDVIE